MHVGRRVYRDHIITHPGSSFLKFIRLASLRRFARMTLLKFFTTVLLFLGITSMRTYAAPYEDIQLPFSTIPRLIYTAESNPTFSGYSYATQDFNGGESNVVFTTGADSVNRLKNEMNSMKILEKYPQRDILDRTQENLVSSEKQSKSEKVEANTNKENFNSNVEVYKEEKKPLKNFEANNDFIEYQAPQQISLTDAPYSANFLNFDFPAVLPKYQISSDIIQNEYYSHNPYARLELPLNNFDNFDFYNPSLSLFYQAAVSIPDNSFGRAITVENVKTSVEPHVTKSLQTNATSNVASKSGVIESRFNQESVTKTDVETSSKSDIQNKLESTTERNKEEILSSKSVNPAVTSESSIEQTTENKINNTEQPSTEVPSTVSPSTEKSSTTRPKRCRRCT